MARRNLDLGIPRQSGRKKDGLDWRTAWGLVVLGEEDGGGGSISFSDDPEFDSGRAQVDRQEPEALDQGQLVLRTVVFADIAPVA